MRMRFTKAERAAFTPGTRIEWRNGRHWHAGVIVGEISRRDGWDHVGITNQSRTGGVAYGQYLTSSPTHLRLPEIAEPVTMLDRFRAAGAAHDATRKDTTTDA